MRCAGELTRREWFWFLQQRERSRTGEFDRLREWLGELMREDQWLTAQRPRDSRAATATMGKTKEHVNLVVIGHVDAVSSSCWMVGLARLPAVSHLL